MFQRIAISIHALLAESDDKRCKFSWNNGISIHALLAESDLPSTHCNWMIAISIHALLAESDTGILAHHARKIVFLSTLSLRRATF